MTKIDLRLLANESVGRAYDVCIVGAGAAGLYLARRLAAQGNRVAILEAGGDTCLPGSAIGFEAAFLADAYGGAGTGRAFGVGGSTSAWGGQLLPYSVHDEHRNSAGGAAWSHVVALVQHHSDAVHAVLGLGKGEYFTLAEEYLRDRFTQLSNAGFAVLVSDWLPFRRRNLRFLIDDAGTLKGSLDLYTHAVVVSWGVEPQPSRLARIKSVLARSINGHELQVSATEFVVAAGAIESARILLELFAQPGIVLAGSKRAIGRYLSDHLSVPVAMVSPADRRRVALMFGARFRNGRMRTFRFVNRRIDQKGPRAFFHFSFLQENPGFHLARKILGGLQARTIPQLRLAELVGGVQGLLGLAYERYANRRLFVPSDTPVQLQLDIEQTPRYDNCLVLSGEKDGYGRQKLNIRWSVSPYDYENLQTATRHFLSRWPSAELGMSRLTQLNSIAPGTKLYDSYHPVGVCRMGEDEEAVVTHDLQVHGLSNVSLASTGVFPSAGTANPTFSLLCLAEALATRLGKIGH